MAASVSTVSLFPAVFFLNLSLTYYFYCLVYFQSCHYWLFWGWGKISARTVDRRRKILKIHWLKCPKTAPKKRNFDQKIDDWNPYIWSLSINFRFSGRKSQSQQEKAKKITNFTIQFRSKNPTLFVTNLNSLNIIKIYSRVPNNRTGPFNRTEGDSS